MKSHRSPKSLSRTVLTATLIALSISFSACNEARDQAIAEAERVAAEARVLEDKVLAEEALREAEALARAEAEEAAAAAREALKVAEKTLLEQETQLAEREAQVRRQQALLDEKQRLAERDAAIEAREQELFELERELEAREINLAVAEDELRARELEDPAAVQSDWSGSTSPGASGEADGDLAGTPIGTPIEGTPIEARQASLRPGKVFEVEILETLSSRSHRVGDTFPARLVRDLRAEDGTLVIPEGSEVVGEVTEVTPLKRVGGRASLGVEFRRIIAPSGEAIEIRAGFVEMGVDKREDKKKIIGAAVAGAILGRVLGGKGGENAVLGAAVGAAAGSAVVARAKDKDAEIPAGEMVALQLEEIVTVEVEMTGTVDP